MGDLLKNMRSSQVFSVCGLPEVKVSRDAQRSADAWRVELVGLDVFDPITMSLIVKQTAENHFLFGGK